MALKSLQHFWCESNISKMEAQGLPLDRISSLPPNIIHTILTRMPLRDAFKTSILSHNWRYHCRNIPKLVFDDFNEPPHETLPVKCKLFHIVYSILLLHQGPILAFSLALLQLKSCCEIDHIILHLSRNATLKEFTLWIRTGDAHKILPAFFNLQHLTVLKLVNCVFNPPVTFKGFSRLVTLCFYDVIITAKDFQRLVSSCPLLKDLTLVGDEKHLLGCWSTNFVELFKCLPLVKHLRMSRYPVKCFDTGQKLPISQVHLKSLQIIGPCFGREADLFSVLSLVTSSNSEKIEMKMDNNPTEAVSQSIINLVDHQDYSCVILDHLRVIKITNFTNMKTGMDFVKLILAKSPMLKKVDIHINNRVDILGQFTIVKELIQYPRASARAEIMIN